MSDQVSKDIFSGFRSPRDVLVQSEINDSAEERTGLEGYPRLALFFSMDIVNSTMYKEMTGEPHKKWTAVYLSVDMCRMGAGQKSELKSWGSSTPKPLDSVRFGDTSTVPQKRAACPKITRLLSGRK